MNCKKYLFLLAMGGTISLLAGMEPLLWRSDIEWCKTGGKTFSLTSSSLVQSENEKKFISLNGRNLHLFSDLPRGDSLGDIRFTFSFRSKDPGLRIGFVSRNINGGCRRFRCDTLKQIEIKITKKDILIEPSYNKSPYDKIKYMTSEPRDHGKNLTPFPQMKNGTYNFPQNVKINDGNWHRFEMTMDQNDLIIHIDGHKIVKHEIYPSAGSFQFSSIGAVDYTDFEIREIRPAYDPYLEENLLTEQNRPIRYVPKGKKTAESGKKK